MTLTFDFVGLQAVVEKLFDDLLTLWLLDDL